MRSLASIIVLTLTVLQIFGIAAHADERLKVTITEASIPVADRVFGYGGGMWRLPSVIDVISEDILKMKPGIIRVAVGWEIFSASKNRKHLQSLLRKYRANKFLTEFSRRGGRVIVSLDGMPRWLARDKSSTAVGDGPAWAKSPPQDLLLWSEIVGDTVRHFNGILKTGAYYEVWNEPDWSFRGKLKEYFSLYKATVIGARRADPMAKIGGPGLSDWTAPNIGGQIDTSDTPLFFQKFLQYAARSSAPSVGLKKLPVDFLTWHMFNQAPDTYHHKVIPSIRQFLRKSGYDQNTPLIIDEWNIAATPPYPEGNLNATLTGAAYVTAHLIEMAKAGVDGQVFQMLVDPGAKGYAGGTFSVIGLPRSNFQSFRLAGRMTGQFVATTTNHPWLHAIASRDGNVAKVLLAAFSPTALMRLRSSAVDIPLRNPEAARQIKRIRQSEIRNILQRKAAIPSDLDQVATQTLTRAVDIADNHDRLNKAWTKMGAVTIQFPQEFANRSAIVYTLDKSSFPDVSVLRQDQNRLQKGLAKRWPTAQKILVDAGTGAQGDAAFLSSIKKNIGATPDLGETANRNAVASAYREMVAPYIKLRQQMVNKFDEDVDRISSCLSVGPDGKLSLEIPPTSVRYIEIMPQGAC